MSNPVTDLNAVVGDLSVAIASRTPYVRTDLEKLRRSLIAIGRDVASAIKRAGDEAGRRAAEIEAKADVTRRSMRTAYDELGAALGEPQRSAWRPLGRFDYEIDENGIMRPLPEWRRDNRATFLRLQLEATNRVTEAEIADWTDAQVQQADCWAWSVMLSASDNDDIQVPERPPFIGGIEL